MPKSVNKVNDNIEENISSNIGLESFDEELYGKNLSELGEQKATQKDDDNKKVEELKNILEGQEYGNLTCKNLILEIIGEKDVDTEIIDDMLNTFTFGDLERIKENKNLILEITGDEQFSIDHLKEDGKGLSELTREELERIKENKDLILEITGKKWFFMVYLSAAGKGLSKLTKEDLKIIKANKNIIGEIDIFDLSNHGKDFCNLVKEKLEKLILDIIGKGEIEPDFLDDFLGELTKEELEQIKKNKDLINEITDRKGMSNYLLLTKELGELTKEELEQIKENKDLILEVTGDEKFRIGHLVKYGKGLSELSREDLERIKENKDSILEITGKEGLFMVYLSTAGKGLSELTKEDLEQIKEKKDLILRITGDENLSIYDLGDYGKGLNELTREELEQIKIICNKMNKEINISTIVFIYKVIKNSNIIKMRDYIDRKQNYLENNELIDDSEFNELFGKKEYSEKEEKIVIKKGKYGKGEINQKGLGYCYFYTALELLKKMNFFEVLIRTNLRQSDDGNGWYVRLPMGQSDGKWIYISKNEIDKKFDVPDEDGGIREQVSINSDTLLGFKILEIAYIKKELINRDKKLKQEFSDTGNVTLTGDGLALLEGGGTGKALKTLIGDNNIVEGFTDHVSEDMVFDNFSKGLMVDLGVKDSGVNSEVKLNKYGNISTEAIEKDVKIISDDENIKIVKSGYVKQNDDLFELIEDRSEEMLSDVIENDGKQQAIFYKGHAYSLGKCYVDKSTGEKRVWIINPHHTGVKFDVSLEKCKEIFDWHVSYIDFDKLFR